MRGLAKAFQAFQAAVRKPILIPAFLSDSPRNQNLIRFGGTAHPGGALDCRAEQIAAVLHRLTTVQPDPNMQRLGTTLLVALESGLDGSGTFHGCQG